MVKMIEVCYRPIAVTRLDRLYWIKGARFYPNYQSQSAACFTMQFQLAMEFFFAFLIENQEERDQNDMRKKLIVFRA